MRNSDDSRVGLQPGAVHLRALLRNAPCAVWTTDDQLQLTSLVGARCTALGLSPQASMGKRVDAVLPATSDGSAGWEAHQIARGGEASAYEFTHDGRSYEVQVEPLTESGTGGTIGVAIDVTARRKLERERLQQRLQRAQKMESLGVLAGGIAHDFNNLLVGVLGNAGLALLDVPEDSPARKRIEWIVASAERASELTRQMLAYSGHGRFVMEEVRLEALVRDMASLLEASTTKMARLDFDFAPGLPKIEVDVAQSRQLVMNLITNASDAIGDEPGTITLRCELLKADRAYLDTTYLDDFLVEGRYLAFSVEDTGCGMDEETVRRMFDPFFTTKETGHGLGLAATLGIVRGHRGAIRVDSEPGNGTIITTLFPLPEQEADPLDSSPGTLARKSVGMILVVDDEVAVRDFAAAALTRFGFEVLIAKDGVEALEIFSADPDRIDAVLLDLTMPRMDGEKTFLELRKIRPWVRVLLSSGYNEQETTARFADQGLAGFIQKPYRPEDLAARLKELVEEELPSGPVLLR